MPTFQPLVQELAPAPDSWALFQQLAHLRYPLFLDSALRHPTLGRYSFAMADPVSWLTAFGNDVRRDGLAIQDDPFTALDRFLEEFRLESLPDLPPFQGGVAGLFGYGLCRWLEQVPRAGIDEFHVQDLAVGWYDVAVCFDHHQDRAWIVSAGYPETDPERRMRRARDRMNEVLSCLNRSDHTAPQRAATNRVTPQSAFPIAGELLSSMDRDAYLHAVRRAIDYVHAGDVFQVNLAHRLLVPDDGQPLQLYQRLREQNRAPFAAYFDLGDAILASASPERFVQVRERQMETRPIKGTRPRSSDPIEDDRLAGELRSSAKDRAENIMIVDLLRNDLGRVGAYGSIEVPQLCAVESFESVHHLVSVVRGTLRPSLSNVDLLRAAFPGGSVTGAPKIRAMEIIAELEPVVRGPYCGCLGYLGCNGTMDTNILIRTFIVGRGWVQFPVGGGIVADSIPHLEYEETWHKAEGMLRALRMERSS